MTGKKARGSNQGQAHASSSEDTMEPTSVKVGTDATNLSAIAPNNKSGGLRKQKPTLPPSAKTEQVPHALSESRTASNERQPMCTPDAEEKVDAVITVPIRKLSILKSNRMMTKRLTISRINANGRSS